VYKLALNEFFVFYSSTEGFSGSKSITDGKEGNSNCGTCSPGCCDICAGSSTGGGSGGCSSQVIRDIQTRQTTSNYANPRAMTERSGASGTDASAEVKRAKRRETSGGETSKATRDARRNKIDIIIQI